MVFISRLKLRNFKSFKAADIQLPKTFICFAGPNGSGKSNLCDAIRFSMGETSLRSLRAKKVKDLIHSGARSAEVTLLFEDENGGDGYEIKRAIREDGKIRYRLNQKKTTRSAIQEALKKHNLDGSGRNTIAQGEVQRIINMNGKERRGIIDSVAGIADFEEKKKEAIHELELVDGRIKEAKLVLGERRAFLDELGREKEIALKYIEAKKTLTNAKGTMLRNEMDRLEKDLGDSREAEEKITASRKAKEHEMAKVDAAVSDVESRRSENNAIIQSKQATNALIKKLEVLKASVSSRKQLVEDKNGAIHNIKAEMAAIGKEISREKEAVAAIEDESQSIRSALKESESALAAAGGLVPEDDSIAKIRKALEGEDAALAELRGKAIFAESEINAKTQLIEAKTSEGDNIIIPQTAEEAEDPEHLRRQAEKLAKEIDGSFSRTKQINSQMADLDRQMLELKEKASLLRLRSSPQLANPALSFINELAKKDKSIHGTVADLISFEPKYAAAIEAAGGSRLLYVVVDSVDSATEAINKLKSAKAGRATFIPLDTVRTPQPAKSGGFGSIISEIEFKENVRRAVEYVFADTLLVTSVVDAKKLGIGGQRMVTEDGEIFERSGIVSGGRNQSGMLGANALRKIEEEVGQVKSEKDSMLQELYSIREEESRLRGEKAQLEIRIKTIELKRNMMGERAKEIEQATKRKEMLLGEISGLKDSVAKRKTDFAGIMEEISASEKKALEMKETLKAAENEFRKASAESNKMRADLSADVSSQKARLEGKRNELDIRKKESQAKAERLKKMEKDESDALAKVEETIQMIKGEERELKETEERITSASKEVEKLFERMKALEDELTELGKKRGVLRIELDRIARDFGQFELKKATAQQRLEDISAEFASYSSAEMIKAGKEELNRMISECEKLLGELGNVNMAAIDMFDKRKAEIEDVESRIEKLDHEREAVLSMISEIDEHKKEAFFETFNAVSENFSGMFKHINVGQGHLYLSDPSNPFESGLFIKLRRNNVEHALDALSGGEKTLVALMFIFAMQLFKPAPFYILDEVDAALDKPNSKNLAELVAGMSRDSQFIVVSHNDTVMSNSESVIGVTKTDNVSKLVGIKLKQVATA